jgi:hypothetical protein
MNLATDLVLCLTASIDPQGMPGVSRPDPKVRETDYVECLRFHSEQFPQVQRIVFIENSGWPLDRLRHVASTCNPHGKRFEFISLQCNNFPRELGKSYGEFLLMDRGLEQSQLARDAGYLAKLTGRNYLLNLTQILERTRQSFQFMCDLRDHPLYEWLHIQACGRHADTRFLTFTPQFYDRHVRGQYVRCDESKGFFAENLFYEIAKNPALASVVIPRFPVEPQFRGVAGHLNKNYGSGRDRLKQVIRGTGRKIMPWLRI